MADNDDSQDGTPDLDRVIAEARAQRAEIQALADSGDSVAQLLVKRLDEAEARLHEAFAKRMFGE